MYNTTLEHNININITIGGSCLAFYLHKGWGGIQEEDDGYWFNKLGPFSMEVCQDLIHLLEKVGPDNPFPTESGYFLFGVSGKFFTLSVKEEHRQYLGGTYEAWYSLKHEDRHDIEYRTNESSVHLRFLSDLVDNITPFGLLVEHFSSVHKPNQPTKALDIFLSYKGTEDRFSIYTHTITLNLGELVHQSMLQSSAFPIKLYMGSEYVCTDTIGKVEGTIQAFRQELRRKVGLLCNDPNVLVMLEDAFSTADSMFGGY